MVDEVEPHWYCHFKCLIQVSSPIDQGHFLAKGMHQRLLSSIILLEFKCAMVGLILVCIVCSNQAERGDLKFILPWLNHAPSVQVTILFLGSEK